MWEWHNFVCEEKLVNQLLVWLTLREVLVEVFGGARRIQSDEVVFPAILHQGVTQDLPHLHVHLGNLFYNSLLAMLVQKVIFFVDSSTLFIDCVVAVFDHSR